MASSSWGTKIRYGEFEIVGARENNPRLIGGGNRSKTFEAMREEEVAGALIRDFVALKVLNPALLASERKRVRFVEEMVALTRFKHPNLIRSINCGEEDGEVFLAMELCSGGDLTKLVKRFGLLPERAVALIGLQVAAGLQEMHQRHGLVHRDIKPSHIVLVDELEKDIGAHKLAARIGDQDSLCRIIDFGQIDFIPGGQGKGSRPRRHRFAGTPLFASPEQVREQPVDGRGDIYSLGLTLWFLAQGKGPFLDSSGNELSDLGEVFRRHTDLGRPHSQDFPPDWSADFREVIARMVAKDASDRFPSAAEALEALNACAFQSGKTDSPGAEVVEVSGRGWDPFQAASQNSEDFTAGHRWQPPTMAEVSAMLPQYEIEAFLGNGGMGAVYRGRQRVLDRPVAIKILPAPVAKRPELVERFKREARVLARLQHPGIVGVYEFGQAASGHFFFVMEYVSGLDLHRFRVLKKPASRQSLEIIVQVCDALHYAHTQDIIHRDIKPSNILVGEDGKAKLADFGLARSLCQPSTFLTNSRVVLGTPEFLAPEQLRGESDHRSDIFALGVTLYHVLTGEAPKGSWEPPSHIVPIDHRIDEVVRRAMQPRPEKRHQSVMEFKTEIERILAFDETGEPGNSGDRAGIEEKLPAAAGLFAGGPASSAAPTARLCQPAGSRPPGRFRSRAGRLRWAVVAFVLIGLAGALGFALFFRNQGDQGSQGLALGESGASEAASLSDLSAPLASPAPSEPLSLASPPPAAPPETSVMPGKPIVFSKGISLEGIAPKPVPEGLLKAEAAGQPCSITLKPATGEAVITPPSEMPKTFELKISAAGWIAQSFTVGGGEGQAYLADGAYRVAEPCLLKRERVPLPVKLPPQKLVDYDYLDVEWIGPLKDQPGAVFVLNQMPAARSVEGPKMLRLRINGDESSLQVPVSTGKFRLTLTSGDSAIIKPFLFKEEIEVNGNMSNMRTEVLPASISGTYAGLVKHNYIKGGDKKPDDAYLYLGLIKLGHKLAGSSAAIEAVAVREFQDELKKDSFSWESLVRLDVNFLLGARDFILEDPWTVRFRGLWDLMEYQFVFKREPGTEIRLSFTMPDLTAGDAASARQLGAAYDWAVSEVRAVRTGLPRVRDKEVATQATLLYEQYWNALTSQGDREADLRFYTVGYGKQFEMHRKLCGVAASKTSGVKDENYAYGTFFPATRAVMIVFENDDWILKAK